MTDRLGLVAAKRLCDSNVRLARCSPKTRQTAVHPLRPVAARWLTSALGSGQRPRQLSENSGVARALERGWASRRPRRAPAQTERTAVIRQFTQGNTSHHRHAQRERRVCKKSAQITCQIAPLACKYASTSPSDSARTTAPPALLPPSSTRMRAAHAPSPFRPCPVRHACPEHHARAHGCERHAGAQRCCRNPSSNTPCAPCPEGSCA
jgi:hypothetical protein